MSGHPLSQSGFDRPHSTSIPLPSTSGSGPTPGRKVHYRPFSSQPSCIDIPTAHPSSLRRSTSVGGLHQVCNGMGLQFGSKGRKDFALPISPAVLPSVPGASSSFRATKKRSMASIFAATDPFTAPPSQSTCSDELPVINISKNHVSHEELDVCDKFVPKNIWAKRCNMKLHPYHRQVAYMQAYDPISLASDQYTELLLKRLANGSPSFHDYGSMPPTMVLDLGCGQGNWILHAAKKWRNTEFVGLDIVDTTLPTFETVENVSLVRGDFLNYKFPFPDNTFDFVRMANLALCIPHDKWEFVLSQVHRVLTPGGRLELIDDDIYFPYGEGSKEGESLVPTSPLSGSFFGDGRLQATPSRDMGDHEMRQDENTDDGDSTFIAGAADSGPVTFDLSSDLRLAPSRPSRYSLSRRPSSPHDPLSESRRPDPRPPRPRYGRTDPKQKINGKHGYSSPPCPKRAREKVALLPPIRSFTPTFSLSSRSRYSPAWSLQTTNTSPTRSDSSTTVTVTSTSTSIGSVVNQVNPKNLAWQQKASASQNMESLFEKMLVEQYGIHPRPSEFILQVLGKVFHDENDGAGEAQARMTKSFHIKLAPIEAEAIADHSDSDHVVGKERGRGSMEEADGMSSISTGMGPTFSTVDANPPKHNGTPVLTVRSRPWEGQGKRLGVYGSRNKKGTDKNKKNNSKLEEPDGRQCKPKDTPVVAVKTTATMTVSLFKRSHPQDPALSTPVWPTLSAKAAGILGIPYSELSAVTLSLSLSSEERRPPVMPWPCSSNLSTKAAGLCYSEGHSAAPSFSVSRNVAHLTVPSSCGTSPTRSEPASSISRPVQHPGLLIWPDTYVPMAPAELEMHACKYIHTLLGCRHALEEFVAKFVDEKGDRFVGEEEFRDEIWEYECFRRARYNWPSEAAESFEDDPNAPGPPSPVPCTLPSGAGTAGSVEAHHPAPGKLDLPPIITGSVSTNGQHKSTTTTHQPRTTGDFSNEKVLRPTKSSLLLRSSSPTRQRSPLRSFMPLKTKSKKVHTSYNSRSMLSALSAPSCPRENSSDELYRSMIEGNRGFRKLDDLVHLRSIRVFEGIKAA